MRINLLMLLLIVAGTAFAQQQTYSAKVVNAENEALIGATVNIVGTDNFTITDLDGIFSLKTDTTEFTIRITSIGFEGKDIEVTAGRLPQMIVLNESTEQLTEVVVTALGIERDKESLTSSVTKVSAKQLSEVPLTNLVNSLAGQVAGVQITNGSSGAGSSSRIIIRGENSLSGNNQPLFVVDGVPISNQLVTSNLFNDGGNIQEVDFGNGVADLNPDDIASISILKGPGSAALYGTRANNGVVLITTRRGINRPGLNITTSSAVTFEELLTLPDYQNVYGGGSNGQYGFQNGIGAGVNDGGISSYGPRLDQGQLIPQFDSPSVDVNGNPVRAGDVIARTRPDGSYTEITPTPWVARPDNVRDFFETGFTSQHNVAINLNDISLFGSIFRDVPDGVDGQFMQYAELQFALAEAAARGYISGDAETYYQNGIAASFEYFHAELPDDYFSRPSVDLDGSDDLTRILTQKWLSLINNGHEAWFNIRRTGIPALKAGPDNLNDGRYPVRYLYPESEQATNGVNYREAADRMGGDDINSLGWWER